MTARQMAHRTEVAPGGSCSGVRQWEQLIRIIVAVERGFRLKMAGSERDKMADEFIDPNKTRERERVDFDLLCA